MERFFEESVLRCKIVLIAIHRFWKQISLEIKGCYPNREFREDKTRKNLMIAWFVFAPKKKQMCSLKFLIIGMIDERSQSCTENWPNLRNWFWLWYYVLLKRWNDRILTTWNGLVFTFQSNDWVRCFQAKKMSLLCVWTISALTSGWDGKAI